VRDSIRRGDPVVVVGKLKTEQWTKDDVQNSRFILEATSVGHDLARGVSRFRKAPRPVPTADGEANGARAAVEEIEDATAVTSADDGPRRLKDAS